MSAHGRIEAADAPRCTIGELAAWLRLREPMDARYVDEVEGVVTRARRSFPAFAVWTWRTVIRAFRFHFS